jgi:membrane-associated protease RseP (regulator of RpoE activity)
MLVCAAPWLGAPLAAADSATASAAAAPAAKPSLGIKIDTSDAATGFQNGLPVAEVLPGGTADTIGMQVGDLIKSVDGTPVKQVEDVVALINKAKVGDPVEVGVTRGPKSDAVTLKGVLLEKPVVVSTGKRLVDIKRELDSLRGRAAHDPSLPELLNSLSDKLGDLQRDLPKAAELFRQQYPKGRFRVKIVIDITSDATATDPVEIGVDDDATAAATATGASATTPTGK